MDMEQMTEWLLGRVNETLAIRKQEGSDTDEVILDLRKVSYGHGRHHDIDDYLSGDRIVLHGQGTISGKGGGGGVELPGDAYEIPLAGDVRASVEQDELHIRTDRAEYHVGAVRH